MATHVNSRHHIIRKRTRRVVTPVHIRPPLLCWSLWWSLLGRWVGAWGVHERGPPSGSGIPLRAEEGPWGFAGRCDSGVPRGCCRCPWSRGHCWWGTDLFQKAGSSLAGGCSSSAPESTIWHLGAGEGYGVHAADNRDHFWGGSRWCLDQGKRGFGPR